MPQEVSKAKMTKTSEARNTEQNGDEELNEKERVGKKNVKNEEERRRRGQTEKQTIWNMRKHLI